MYACPKLAFTGTSNLSGMIISIVVANVERITNFKMKRSKKRKEKRSILHVRYIKNKTFIRISGKHTEKSVGLRHLRKFRYKKWYVVLFTHHFQT